MCNNHPVIKTIKLINSVPVNIADTFKLASVHYQNAHIEADHFCVIYM